MDFKADNVQHWTKQTVLKNGNDMANLSLYSKKIKVCDNNNNNNRFV